MASTYDLDRGGSVVNISLEKIADMIAQLEATSESRAIELKKAIADVQVTATRLQIAFASLHKDVHNGRGLGARLRKIERAPEEIRAEIAELKSAVMELKEGGCA